MEHRQAAPERRRLTVLFCDMVGSSALSQRLDPEDLRDVIRLYQKTCTSGIERYAGLVTSYVGDGIMALFGYPKAHEDDPERAISAGLAIAERVAGLEPSLGDSEIRIAVRVGIATGLVVAGDLIGEGVAEEAAVVGETPNLAARLQQVAEPNTVVVHDTSKHSAGARFEYADLGLEHLPGFDAPVRAWRVLGRRPGRSRFEAAHRADLAPLVGRDASLAELLEHWRVAAQGRGQAVLLGGEAGIGKSRVAQALDEELDAIPHGRIRYQCSSYHRGSALHPFIEELEWAASIAAADSAEEKLDKLEALAERAGLEVEESLPLLAGLLSVAGEGRFSLDSMSPQQRKQRTIDAVVDRLRRSAAASPLLVLFEDIQWADPTSLELIQRLVDAVRSAPMLLLITARPEFGPPPWTGQHVAQVVLERLAPDAAATLVRRVAAGTALPRALVERIVASTDGVPLFIEEVTKAVCADASLSPQGQREHSLSVPPSLQDTLAARLDHAGDVKEIAQLGAAIGRHFSHALVAAAAEPELGDLDEGLDRLVAAGLLYREGRRPEATYSFKHALLQNAAYESLLRGRRRELHARIADALAARFPETVRNEPELLAHHLFEARRYPDSARQWLLAGRAAIERSANIEAAAHMRNALRALEHTADAAAVEGLELQIQLVFGLALTASEGFASPSVEAAYARARELCATAGEGAELFYALCGLGSFYTVRADLAAAREIAARMLAVGESADSSDLLVWGHVALGITELYSGVFDSAIAHLKKGIAAYDAERHGHHAFVFGQDAGVIGLSHLAWAAWLRGAPEEALEHKGQAVELAGRLSHPFSHAYALTFAAWLDQFLGNAGECARSADLAIARCRSQGFPLLLGMALVTKGWSVSADSDPAAGLVLVEEGMGIYQRTGAELGMPAMLGVRAVVAAQAGNVGEALEIAESALGLATERGELMFEAELHRLIAELSLARVEMLPLAAQASAREHASESARLAVETARSQGTRMLRLRAALTGLHAAVTPRDKRDNLAQLAELCTEFDSRSPLLELERARELIAQAG